MSKPEKFAAAPSVTRERFGYVGGSELHSQRFLLSAHGAKSKIKMRVVTIAGFDTRE